MSAQQVYRGTNWFKRFLIFLLGVIVIISFGLMIYYFLQDDETLGLDKSSVMLNKGDTFTLTIIHENPKDGTTYTLDYDENVLECTNSDTADTVYEFEAIGGGTTQILLETNNQKFQNMNCVVSVGSGTQTNPFYIKTPEDLASIGTGSPTDTDYRSLSACYLQMNSIDLEGYNAGVWTPLSGDAGFSGSYDGAGFTIYNMTVTASANSNAGLFTKINASGTVTRVIFSEATVSGEASNAGVVAGINSGTVSRIEVIKSTVSSLNSSGDIYVGGIVGKMIRTSTNTRLDRVAFYSDSSILVNSSANAYVGGLTGLNQSGTIINSFSRGLITTLGENVVAGGIAGKNSTDTSYTDNLTTSKKGNIINCYTTMLITASTKGAVVGVNVNRNGTQTYTNNLDANENRLVGVYYIYDTSSAERDLYWSSTATASNAVLRDYNLITGIDFTQALAQNTYLTYNASSLTPATGAEWNFDYVWQIEGTVNDGLPTLRMMGISVSDNIYDPQTSYDGTIVNQLQLSQIALDMNGSYEIGDDFVLTGDWTSIGTASVPFNGTLDGKGYIITVGAGVDFDSLFGYLGPNAQIINLHLISANIVEGNNVGVLAQYNNGLIENCYLAGNITVSGTADKNVGGIVGVNSSTGKITGSVSAVNIVATVCDGKTDNVGGIAGLNNGMIQDCETSANTQISVSNSGGTAYAGGIAGQNASAGMITLCYNYCDVITTTSNKNSFAGGIAGYNNYRATLQKCVTGANVTPTAENRVTVTGYWAGGLVGYNSGDDINTFVNIQQCQVNKTTTVSGIKAGGLVGRMYRGVMKNCATYAHLSADTMAGFAVTVEGYSGSDANGKYAIIDTCFSSATFNGTEGRAYAETSSYIRATNNFLYCVMRGEDTSNPNSYKIAGYINNSKYNKTNLDATGQGENSYRQYSSAYIGSWNWETPNDGGTSDADCKKSGTFDLTRWTNDIWEIANGQYPQVRI